MLEIRSFRDVLRLLFVFKREFKIAIVSTVAIAVLGAFLLPLKFESEARLLVKNGRENSIMSIDAGNRQPLIAPTTVRDPIIDEEKMLTRPLIVKQVAEQYLVLMQDLPPPDGIVKRFKHHFKKVVGDGIEVLRVALVSVGLLDDKTLVERTAKKLQKNFSVEHAAGSSVMDVSFTWDDPFVAQQIVQVWVDLYLAERVSVLSQSSTLYDFYNVAKAESAKELESLQLRINARLESLGVIDFGVVFNNLTLRLSALREDRFQAINEYNSLVAGINESLSLQKQLSLSSQLKQLRVDLTAQLRTFQEGSEQILNLRQGIKSLEKDISDELVRQNSLKETLASDVLLMLDDNILLKKARVKEVQVLILGYEKEITSVTEKLQQLLADKPELLKLNAELLAAEKNYSLYLGNYEKARIDYELDKERISNIAVIEAASLNPSRVFPKSINIILASIPISFLVAIFTLYACYLLDQRIHDGGQIEKYFGVKFWTSLNEVVDDRADLDSHFQANLYRIYSQLPLDVITEKGLAIGLTSAQAGEGVSFIAARLRVLLEEQGVTVIENDRSVGAGQVKILECSALLNNSSVLVNLRQADLIVLIVQAVATTLPTVEHTISILETAFEKIDGIVLNRRKLEVPSKVLRYFSPKVSQLR